MITIAFAPSARSTVKTGLLSIERSSRSETTGIDNMVNDSTPAHARPIPVRGKRRRRARPSIASSKKAVGGSTSVLRNDLIHTGPLAPPRGQPGAPRLPSFRAGYRSRVVGALRRECRARFVPRQCFAKTRTDIVRRLVAERAAGLRNVRLRMPHVSCPEVRVLRQRDFEL